MAEPIRIRIRGSDGDTDAPTIEDFVEQVRDLVAILHGVEQAIDPYSRTAIEWRVTDASMNSPIALEATPFPMSHGTFIEPRAREVLHHTAWGLNQLKVSDERPPYFNEAVLGRAKKLSLRVTNGLSLTEIEFGRDEPDFTITPQVASLMVANAERVLAPPKVRPYREQGSLEGFFVGIAHDGKNRAVLSLKSRVTGEDIKCFLRGEAKRYVRDKQIADVLDGRRVRVYGTLLYKAPRVIDYIEVRRLDFLAGRETLPTLDDISDPDFTGGMRSEDYLEALRDGRLN